MDNVLLFDNRRHHSGTRALRGSSRTGVFRALLFGRFSCRLIGVLYALQRRPDDVGTHHSDVAESGPGRVPDVTRRRRWTVLEMVQLRQGTYQTLPRRDKNIPETGGDPVGPTISPKLGKIPDTCNVPFLKKPT